MTITKNNFLAHLKTPLVGLCSVSVALGRNMSECLQIIPAHDINQMLRKSQEYGRPRFAAISDGRRIVVFPRTDKRYRFRVIGTQYVEQ